MSKQIDPARLKDVYKWFAATSLPRTLAAEKASKKAKEQSA